MDGTTNIKAGIAWLYYNAIRLNIRNDVTVYDGVNVLAYTMQKNETIASVAGRLETTSDAILTENGLTEIAARKLGEGTILKYRKSHKEDQIGSWAEWKTAVLRYNGKGDAGYQDKFERALQIILSREQK